MWNKRDKKANDGVRNSLEGWVESEKMPGSEDKLSPFFKDLFGHVNISSPSSPYTPNTLNEINKLVKTTWL